jgi:PP-loop superfamily ATP-utilizing enzyme
MKYYKCDICQGEFDESQLISGHGIRHELENLIREDYPKWSDSCNICRNDFDKYRMKYLVNVI